VYDFNNRSYRSNGADFDSLKHLSDIGFITLEYHAQFEQVYNIKNIVVSYYDKLANIEFSKQTNNKFSHGKVTLTQIGRELVPIANGKPLEGFYEYLLEEWRKLGYKTPVFPVGNKADSE
jgi:hypothetical protein